MRGSKFILLLCCIVFIQACVQEEHSPFTVDAGQGIFLFERDQLKLGPCTLNMNGFSVLQNSHSFYGKDSLVTISSFNGMDVITIFKEINGGAMVSIRIVNPADSAQEIKSVDLQLKNTRTITQVLPAAERKTDLETLWRWSSGGPEDSTKISLDLSESSIILLPEERIVLPSLQFFSHLCSN